MKPILQRVRAVLLPALAASIALPALAADDPLAAHRWRDRVLVVASSNPGDPRLAEQRRLCRAARRGMRERDLVLVEAVGKGARAAAIRRHLAIPDGAFSAVLVGKDGDAKLRADQPIATEKLFDTIDGMPMRRDEMRRRPAG